MSHNVTLPTRSFPPRTTTNRAMSRNVTLSTRCFAGDVTWPHSPGPVGACARRRDAGRLGETTRVTSPAVHCILRGERPGIGSDPVRRDEGWADMCGICGAAWTSPGRALATSAGGMMDRIVHRGPDDAGTYRDAHAALGLPPALDRRPGRRPPAALQRGRHGLDRLQRRDLQLPRPAAPARGAGAHPPLDGRHRGPRPPLRGRGARAVPPPARDVRPGDLGRARGGRWSWAATGSGRSRWSTAHDGDRIVFASELKALLALPEAGRAPAGRSRWRSTAI